jgi:hypothetical protein
MVGLPFEDKPSQSNEKFIFRFGFLGYDTLQFVKIRSALMRRFTLPGAVLAMIVMGNIFFLPFDPALTLAQTSNPKKFEEYRAAVQKEYGIDIKNFKGSLKGGRADGKDLTKYNLQQLLLGIKIELEHASDRMTALEITTDHLEEIPDYYNRLLNMKKEAEAELERKKGKGPTQKRAYP